MGVCTGVLPNPPICSFEGIFGACGSIDTRLSFSPTQLIGNEATVKSALAHDCKLQITDVGWEGLLWEGLWLDRDCGLIIHQQRNSWN